MALPSEVKLSKTRYNQTGLGHEPHRSPNWSIKTEKKPALATSTGRLTWVTRG